MGKWKALVFSNTQKHLQLRQYLCTQQINGNEKRITSAFKVSLPSWWTIIVRWNPPPSPTPPHEFRNKHILGDSWTQSSMPTRASSSCLQLAHCTETRVHLFNGPALGHAYMDWLGPDVYPPILYIQLHHRNFYSVISINFCEIGTFMYLRLLTQSERLAHKGPEKEANRKLSKAKDHSQAWLNGTCYHFLNPEECCCFWS